MTLSPATASSGGPGSWAGAQLPPEPSEKPQIGTTTPPGRVVVPSSAQRSILDDLCGADRRRLGRDDGRRRHSWTPADDRSRPNTDPLPGRDPPSAAVEVARGHEVGHEPGLQLANDGHEGFSGAPHRPRPPRPARLQPQHGFARRAAPRAGPERDRAAAGLRPHRDGRRNCPPRPRGRGARRLRASGIGQCRRRLGGCRRGARRRMPRPWRKYQRPQAPAQRKPRGRNHPADRRAAASPALRSPRRSSGTRSARGYARGSRTRRTRSAG